MSKEQVQYFLGLQWNWEIDENQKPDLNMSLDVGAVKQCLQHPEQGFLRLYSWLPHAISIGAHQNLQSIDGKRCAELGYAVVRRPTGGRAILHAHELTYSIAVSLDTLNMNHHEVYHLIHHCLLAALQNCGFTDLRFEKAAPKFSELYTKELSSALCFSSSARHEVVWSGKKVIGSAQKLYRAGVQTVVLQHGSILLGPGHEQLADLLVVPSPEQQTQMKERILERSITLEQIVQRKVEFLPIAKSIAEIFEKNITK